MRNVFIAFWILVLTPNIHSKAAENLLRGDWMISDTTAVFSNFKISPDEEYTACTKRKNGQTYLALKSNFQPINKTKIIELEKGFSVTNFEWSSNSESILFVSSNSQVYNLNLLHNIGKGNEQVIAIQHLLEKEPVICHISEKGPAAFVLMGSENSPTERLFQVNLQYGNAQPLSYNYLHADRMYLDRDDQVRLSAVSNTELNQKLLLINLPGYALDTLLTCNLYEDFEVLTWNEDNSKVYFTTNALQDDLSSVYEYDFSKKKITRIAKDPENKSDISRAYFDSKTGDFLGTSYYYTSEKSYWGTPLLQEVYDSAAIKFPNSDIHIESFSDKLDALILKICTDTVPCEYFLFDHANFSFELITSEYDFHKNSESVFHTKPFTYKSTDGQEITGYLTLPNQKKQNNLPLIVLLHHHIFTHRTFNTFNPFVQMLAEKGYAVFQPNFRGVSGFGKNYLQSGFEQWGELIQEDISSGIKQLISQKTVHAKKVLLIGEGHGGYEAMMGLIKNHDLFAGAVVLNGYHTLESYVRSVPPHWSYIQSERILTVGNPYTDSGLKKLKKNSPSSYPDKMSKPLLFIQEKDNSDVILNESIHFLQDIISSVKKKKRKNINFLVQEAQESNFNRVALNAVEQFFYNTVRSGSKPVPNPTADKLMAEWTKEIQKPISKELSEFEPTPLVFKKPWLFNNEFIFYISYEYNGKTHQFQVNRSYEKQGKERWIVQDQGQEGVTENFYYNKNLEPVYREVFSNDKKEEWTLADEKIYFNTAYGKENIANPGNVIMNGIGIELVLSRLPLEVGYKANIYLADEYSNQLKPCVLEVIGTEDIKYFEHFIVRIANLEDSENYIIMWIDGNKGFLSKSIQKIPSLGNLIIRQERH